MQDTIRVEAPDFRSAVRLVEQAAAAYEAELVPLPRDAWEVRVAKRGEREPLVADLLAIVERWLDEQQVPTTTVHLDGHLYTVNRRVPVA